MGWQRDELEPLFPEVHADEVVNTVYPLLLTHYRFSNEITARANDARRIKQLFLVPGEESFQNDMASIIGWLSDFEGPKQVIGTS